VINRHNRCIGLTLFRFRRRKLELWFCPSYEIIPDHVHEHIDSTIIMLAGGMWGRIGTRSRYVGWLDMFRSFSIPKGVSHSAITGAFAVFANWEKWDTDDVTSAAKDFKAVC